MTAAGTSPAMLGYRCARTVDVGPPPHLHLGYVKEAGQVWVSNGGGDSITVLDHTTGERLTDVRVGAGPAHFSFNVGCTLGFVALRDSDQVAALDPRTHEVLARIALPPGSKPTATMPAFDRNRFYLLNAGNGTVSAIDTDTLTLAATIDVGAYPHWAQPWGSSYKPITKAVGKTYVAGEQTNELTVIDDRTDAVLDRIKVGRGPVRNAIFREHDTIYTANAGDDTVSVVSIAEDEVVATVPVLPGPFRLLPMRAICGRDEMWVLSGGNAGNPGGVSVLDGAEHRVTRTLDLVERPANWVVTLDKDLFVVAARSRQMCVYDLPADRVLATVALDRDPAPAAISGLIRTVPGNVFVLNADATVSVFNTPPN